MRGNEPKKKRAQANYLVCRGSYDTNWKGESKGYNIGKQEPLRRHLDLIFDSEAEYKGNYNCHDEQ